MTVTLRATDVNLLNDRVCASGYRLTTISVRGRFHTFDHSNAAVKLGKLVLQSPDLRLPTVEKMFAPVRSAVDGKILTGGSLVQHILDNTLLKTVDWNLTLKSSVDMLPQYNTKLAAFAGFGNHIPQTLVQNSSLEVFMLSKLRVPKVSKPTVEFHQGQNYPPHSIAIVSMAGRFPGADSVDELWDLIVNGSTTVEPAPAERLRLSQAGDFVNTKWWGNFIRDPDAFDHRFFKKSSREALSWDPQQRYVSACLQSAPQFGTLFSKSSLCSEVLFTTEIVLAKHG